MKNIFKVAGFSLALSLALSLAAGCSEWLEPKSVNETDLSATTKTEEYYASLREWKKTPGLPQVFVWFDSWTANSPSSGGSLTGLPDSVTIASNWGAHAATTDKFMLSEAQKADMEYVQRVKGTKVVFTMFSRFPGECFPPETHPHWYTEDLKSYKYLDSKFGSSVDEEEVRPIIRRYAEDLYNSCIEAGYDGYDWDYEPGFGMDAPGGRPCTPFYYNETQIKIFCDEMSYWFGPKAMDPERDRGGRPMPKKRLLFIIDGACGNSYMGQHRGGKFDKMPADAFDYFVLQSYNSTDYNDRVSSVVADTKLWGLTEEETVAKTFLTENFETFAPSGGYFLNMASYVHNGTQIGGCGLYRVGNDYNQGKGDYNGSPEYWFLRQGITKLYSVFRKLQAAGPEVPEAPEDESEQK